MKKLLSILVLSLLFGGSGYAKSINLICVMKSSKTILNDNVQYDDVSTVQDQVLIIDLAKKTLLDYGTVAGISESQFENVEINDKTIEWRESIKDFGSHKNILNRISGQLVSTSTYDKDSNIYKALGVSYVQSVSDCRMKEKKF